MAGGRRGHVRAAATRTYLLSSSAGGWPRGVVLAWAREWRCGCFSERAVFLGDHTDDTHARRLGATGAERRARGAGRREPSTLHTVRGKLSCVLVLPHRALASPCHRTTTRPSSARACFVAYVPVAVAGGCETAGHAAGHLQSFSAAPLRFSSNDFCRESTHKLPRQQLCSITCFPRHNTQTRPASFGETKPRPRGWQSYTVSLKAHRTIA